MASPEFELTDHSSDTIREMLRKKAIALEKVGLVAEGYAKMLCPVDTGRLRNSITHATSQNHGQGDYQDNNGLDFHDASAQSKPRDDSVYIGTNVEYAPYIELGTVRCGARPYLRPAAADHIEEYKRIIDAEMRK